MGTHWYTLIPCPTACIQKTYISCTWPAQCDISMRFWQLRLLQWVIMTSQTSLHNRTSRCRQPWPVIIATVQSCQSSNDPRPIESSKDLPVIFDKSTGMSIIHLRISLFNHRVCDITQRQVFFIWEDRALPKGYSLKVFKWYHHNSDIV